MNTLLQDLRFAFRTLARSPGFTAVAIATLAVGIGANTAVFSILSTLFYRPLPFSEPHRLAALVKHFTTSPGTQLFIDPPSFFDWMADSSLFEGGALVATGPVTIRAGDQAQRVEGSQISAATFTLLGVRPVLGRTFFPEEEDAGNSDVVILSDALWRQRFGADKQVLGSNLVLGDRPYTVIGVMAPGFAFPHESALWIPLSVDPLVGRGNNWVTGFVRLRPGVTTGAANAHLAVVSRRLGELYPESNKDVTASLAPMQHLLLGGMDPAALSNILLLMQAAVVLVLLIVCANLTNLLLTRGTARQHEMAIRSALGASRSRLSRQLLTESALLGLLGGVMGLLVAKGALGLFSNVLRTKFAIPDWLPFVIDWRVLVFILLASLITGLVVGVGPALSIPEQELRSVLQQTGRSFGGGLRVNRMRAGLILGEVALATILTAGAGLLIRTVLGLSRVDTGFDRAHTLTLRIPLEGERFQTASVRGGFYNEVTRRFEALPGVEAVGAINLLPLGTINGDNAVIDGYSDSAQSVLVSSVTGHYFRALGIPPIEGREFTQDETARGDLVAIINQTMARHYWPQGSALGRRIRFRRDPPGAWRSIVGVSRDITQGQLQNDRRDQVYIPYGRQYSWPTMSFVVRAEGEPIGLVGMLRAELKSADPIIPLVDVTTMDDVISRSFGDRRLYATTMSMLASVALLLATLGIYGVMSYAVVQQTRSIGVRIALGASPRTVLLLVVSHGLKLAVAGVAAGMLGAFFATRLLRSLLYGVSPVDPVSLVIATLPLLGAALIATLIPAWRATRVDPAVALRHE